MIVYNNIRWKNYQGVLVPDEAPDKEINLTKEQAKHLLKISGTYFIRGISEFDCNFETAFWYVIKDGESTLESLDRKTRYSIRTGLKHCTIKRVCAEVIAKEGYETYKKAFDRYDTFIQPESKEEFFVNILTKKDNPEWEFWGVWNIENKLIGYSMNQIFENRCSYATTKFHPDFLRLRISDSLFFKMNFHYLNERGMKFINDGPRNLSHKTTIQDYLIDKFNFRKAYCKIYIVYNLKIKILVLLLYPFRKFIAAINLNTTNKLTVLLKYEGIRRSFQNSLKVIKR